MSQAGLLKVGGGGGALQTLTGNTGGAIAPTGGGTINVVGTGGVSVAGNAGTHTLTISLSASSFRSASVTLTSAQILDLNNTPIIVLPAPAANQFYLVSTGGLAGFQGYALLNYGGTDAFVAAGSTINYYYGVPVAVGCGNTAIDDATLNENVSSLYNGQTQGLIIGGGLDISLYLNQPITIFNSGTAVAGNAGDDNTVTFSFIYQLITI